jgi:hypothetical protein
MPADERISIALWEAVRGLDLYDGYDFNSPDIDECVTHEHGDFEAAAERYTRHSFYYDASIRSGVISMVVLGVTCLEAYINELIALIPVLSSNDRTNLFRMRLRDKYQKLWERMSSKRFNVHDDPFESFSLLVDVRNAFVHYNLTSSDRAELVNRLEAKIEEFFVSEELVFPSELETPEFTHWVLATVASTIYFINQVIKDSTICFDPYELSHLQAKNWAHDEEDPY